MTILNHPRRFRHHVSECLGGRFGPKEVAASLEDSLDCESAVLLGLIRKPGATMQADEVHVVLNKRSSNVRQAGDLCYPGGSVGNFDRALARLQCLPLSHLRKWQRRASWDAGCREKDRLAMLMTTCLRESWEEMRLNPLKVSFLGLLPPQDLVMFKRRIHPMVGWIRHRARFKRNGEVSRIIPIPLRSLLDASNYGRYHLTWEPDSARGLSSSDHPCFIFHDATGTEVLWGATFYITMSFLRYCFEFTPPDGADLPVVENRLGQAYFNGG
jgi:8-oxo-dGTP pyrophosphatase MutT (NUDIX family)